MRVHWPSLLLAGGIASAAACAGRSEHSADQASGRTGAGAAAGAGGAALAGAPSGGALVAGSPSGRAGAPDAQPSDCALPADYVCTGTHVTPGCHCQPDLVTGDKDCASTNELTCTCSMGDTTMGCVPEQVSWYYDSIVCACDPAAALGPDDCQHTQQFSCEGWQPFREGCHCNLDAPLSAADCVGRDVVFGCEGHDPDIGCACRSTMR